MTAEIVELRTVTRAVGGAGVSAVDCGELVRWHRCEAQARMLREPCHGGVDITDDRSLLISTR